MSLKKNLKQTIIFFILIFFHNNLLFGKDAWIGITFEKNNQQLKEKYSLVSDKGLLLTAINKGSSADIAGLKAGDIVVSVDGNKDFTKNILSAILKEKNPGDILDFEIQKSNNEIKNIKLKVGDIKNKNLHKNITKESEKFALFWGGYYNKFPEDKINKIYLNESFVKKYQTNNSIIVCLDKNSSAYKRGLKIYDEIIEINGKNPII
jgi:S1-C subfamily serine protease